NRLVEPTGGEVLLDGRNLLALAQQELRRARRHIGMIFQEFNLIERLSVLDNVLTGRLGYTGTIRSVFRRFRRDDIGKAASTLDARMLDTRIDAISRMRARTWRSRAVVYGALAAAVAWSVYVIVIADTDWARLAGSSVARTLGRFIEFDASLLPDLVDPAI